VTEFQNSQWRQAEAAAEFVENADRYIVERRRMLAVVRSLYDHFVRPGVASRRAQLLDLGSGDGVWTHELLKSDPTIEAILMDASAAMLAAACTRLKGFPHLRFVHRTFQELLAKRESLPRRDMVVSGLAIHHLDRSEKKDLFAYVRDQLVEDGHFVNVDVVIAPDPDVEEWYMALWREWIWERELRDKPAQSYEFIPKQYKDNADNLPDPLDEQLAALRAVGFKSVDCYYKYGVFAVYGGRR
jgi:tRNA (cmo5U34)-methyltransferase